MDTKRILLILSLVLCLILASCGGAEVAKNGDEDMDASLPSFVGDDKYEALLESKEQSRSIELDPTVEREVNNIISQNIEGCTWNENTVCSSATPYKDPLLNYSGFYVELDTDGAKTGHLLLSYFGEGAMFTDSYSFTEKINIPAGDGTNELLYLGGGELVNYIRTAPEGTHSSITSEKKYTSAELESIFGQFRE